ncbi:TPA: hypothetical protein QCY71_005540 [Bacillus cereus]|nr:hypothetical protein [Bacillus cereus]
MIWNYIDTDDYIHQFGYQKISEQSVFNKVFDFMERNNSESRLFLLISDHGQTCQDIDQEDSIFTLSDNNKELLYKTGGAGRVLYFYPEKEKKASVKVICTLCKGHFEKS